MSAPLPLDEEDRLLELSCFGVMDTAPEPAFDRITRLAAQVFRAPIALVSLLDRDRQWFKSHFGIDLDQTARSQSFCAYTILESGCMIVPDTRLDARFANHPLVRRREPFIRFYAGAPLITHSARYCAWARFASADHRKARQFGAEGNVAMLEDLAAMVGPRTRVTPRFHAQPA